MLLSGVALLARVFKRLFLGAKLFLGWKNVSRLCEGSPICALVHRPNLELLRCRVCIVDMDWLLRWLRGCTDGELFVTERVGAPPPMTPISEWFAPIEFFLKNSKVQLSARASYVSARNHIPCRTQWKRMLTVHVPLCSSSTPAGGSKLLTIYLI